jgi:hypothetical protein
VNEHLRSVDEQYFKHLQEAWKITWMRLLAGGAAFIHGIFPTIFTSTASEILKRVIANHSSRQTKVQQ